MTVYRRDEEWPRHPKPWWREVLDLARDLGWRLDTSSGHAFGTLRCPGSCAVLIFTTGRSGESVAKSARRQVERCPHSDVSPVAAVVRHLDRADALTAAVTQLAHSASVADVEELLDLADEALSAAEEAALLARIDELPSPLNPTPERGVAHLLTEADHSVAAAVKELHSVSSGVAKPYRQRAANVRKRIADVRQEAEVRAASTVSRIDRS